MNKTGKRLFIALTAASMTFGSLSSAKAEDLDLRCWTQKLLGYLHSCPLVVSAATSEQIGLLGKARDTMTRLGQTIDNEQTLGRLSVAQANDMRLELDSISTNLEDAVHDGTLTYDEAHFIVRRLAELDNRADMLIASHPATRVAIDTDIDIRLRDLNGRLAEDANAGLLTEPEADELRRSLSVVAEENSRIKADCVITPEEQLRIKIAMDTVGHRMDELSTNQWVTVRTLFTWSDFEPRQQELMSRVNTAIDQGTISPSRAAMLKTELNKVQQMAASINASKAGGIITTRDLIALRQRQNLIDRQITQEIRLAAKQRPYF